MLNDFKYKNNVLRYKNTVRTHKLLIDTYRFIATNSYKEIATLLNKKLDNVDFILTDEMIKKIPGIYINNKVPEKNIEIYFYNEYVPQLRLKGFNDSPSRILPLNGKNEFSVERIGILKFQENEQGQHITIYHGHEATTYKKLD